jgi:hypothetical protein
MFCALVKLSVKNHKAYKRVDVRGILRWSLEHLGGKAVKWISLDQGLTNCWLV